MVRSHRFVVSWASLAFVMFVALPVWAQMPGEFQPKYDEGYGIGYPIGYRSGLADGDQRGWNAGTTTGKSEGYDDGWSAAYSPAFDLSYDKRFPVGHLAGWKDGVSKGFDEGFDYAPVVAAQMNVPLSDATNYGYSSSAGFVMTVVNTRWSGSIEILDTTSFIDNTNVDWSKHYYDLGYEDGRTKGFSVGSDEGYNLAYPRGYAWGYRVGHIDGVNVGTNDGTRDGRKQGYDVGREAGFDLGFDSGFYAGLDYHLFGDFIEPTYSFRYTARSNAHTAQTLVALRAPEPRSLLLMSVAGAGVCLARRRPPLRGGARRG